MNVPERNLVILVDSNDVQTGVEDKLLAHQKGLLHRAFSIMLYRRNKDTVEFLLQQRATMKYHCGGLWTNTCCSHPQPGEELKNSALNRLQEELLDIDIKAVALQVIDSFIYQANFSNGLTEHEYDYVFLAQYNQTPKFFNRDEIATLDWVNCAKIDQMYATKPQIFTPWFYEVYTLCKDYLT